MNQAKTLKRVESGVVRGAMRCPLRNRQMYSPTREMKKTRVKTWKERPASETLTAGPLLPLDVDDKAPPTAWRMSERMSQGMKIQ